MVLLIIIPMKNGYFIGNINPTFSGPNPNSFSWPQAAEARQLGHCWRKREACGGSWRSQLPLPSQPRWTRSKRSSQSQPETRFTTHLQHHLHFAYPTRDVPSSIWVCPNNRAYPDVAISTDQIMTIYIYIYNHL